MWGVRWGGLGMVGGGSVGVIIRPVGGGGQVIHCIPLG